jgi:hypothetical protein
MPAFASVPLSTRASRAPRATVAIAAALCLAALSGCAFLRGSAARQKYVQSQTEQHVYNRPIQEVWPQVRKLLFEQGYQSKDTDTGGSYSIETEPATKDNKTTRYLVQGTKVSDGSCRIEITRMTIQPKGESDMDRDLQMEWTLLKRVEPDRAKAIESDAEREAERAKQQG